MLSRPHPRHGWLHLQPSDWRQSLQKQIEERDKLNDPTRSGPPPEWCRWCDECQLPRLAQRPEYQRQFSDRITELEMKLANLEHQIAGGRLDLEPAAGMVRREINWIKELTAVPHG
jgi:hypothetical protein